MLAHEPQLSSLIACNPFACAAPTSAFEAMAAASRVPLLEEQQRVAEQLAAEAKAALKAREQQLEAAANEFEAAVAKAKELEEAAEVARAQAGLERKKQKTAEAADTQARNDLVEVFRANVQSLVRRCAAATSTSPRIPEQHMQEAAEALMEMELSDMEIAARWYAPEERTRYSLAVLDLGMFMTRVAQLGELREDVRDAVLAGAEYAFETLGRDTRR